MDEATLLICQTLHEENKVLSEAVRNYAETIDELIRRVCALEERILDLTKPESI